MKKILTLFILFFLTTGCAQNTAMLGSVFTLVSTESVQQVAINHAFNQSIKKNTGKNLYQHAESSLTKELRYCDKIHSNELSEIFFNTLDEIDCSFNN
jgi:hypothetical protein